MGTRSLGWAIASPEMGTTTLLVARQRAMGLSLHIPRTAGVADGGLGLP